MRIGLLVALFGAAAAYAYVFLLPGDAGPRTLHDPPSLSGLVFSKTAGYRHESIRAGVGALREIAESRKWALSFTEDATRFSEEGLAPFDVVVFLNTSGDVLDEAQQAAFESYVESGGGYAGVHAASDTEPDWPWYDRLVGAYFSSHPKVQPADVRVESLHAATIGLPDRWTFTDEWYDFRQNPRDAGITVLLSVDESSYEGGRMGGDHPVSWAHEGAGGRSFYTALGHTVESYSDPRFRSHVAGGIEWAAGRQSDETIVVELDGRSKRSSWARMNPRMTEFPFTVTSSELRMTADSTKNQHVVREGLSVDPSRPYALECDFRIEENPISEVSSFALNFNVAGEDGDSEPISAWSMNLDRGVMKHMGFSDGVFRQIGQSSAHWQEPDAHYRLRVRVNQTQAGITRPRWVTVTVMKGPEVKARFEVDYSPFPYQPSGSSVRIGANSHGADWTLRNLKAFYLDPPGSKGPAAATVD